MRILIFIALVCAAVQGRGQIYIDSYRFGAGADTLLLDGSNFQNAYAAYSFRKLRTAYAGDCIIVRRSIGSPALDTIGFVDNYLDTTTLKTFCAGVNCFVSTWFDQSGSFNLTQTTDAAQPQIVNNGNLIKRNNNKVELRFDGTNDFLVNTGIVAANPKTIFMPFFKGTLTSNAEAFFDSDITTQAVAYITSISNPTLSIAFGTNQTSTYSVALNDYKLLAIQHNGSSSNAYINNVAIYATNVNFGTNAFNGFRLARDRGASTSYYNGAFQEIIIYNSDKSSDRTAISNNINTFYSIY